MYVFMHIYVHVCVFLRAVKSKRSNIRRGIGSDRQEVSGGEGWRKVRTAEDIDLLYSVFQTTLPDLIQTVIFLSVILDFVWNLSSRSEVAFIFLKYHQTHSFSVRYCIVQFLRWYSTLHCYSPTRCFINQPLMLMSSQGTR